MAEDNNVWSASSDNTYQAVTTSNASTDSSTSDTHTRIYEYLSTTIQLDEMSIPLHDNIDSNSDIDASTGQHKDQSNENSDPFSTSGNQSPSKAMSIGVSYPLLRINDHYFTDNDIVYFSLSSVGLIPQIEVRLSCTYADILKSNTIKNGDICSVFISPGHDSIKYYRGDYQIVEARTKDLDQGHYNDKIDIHFIAELFIPNIYDGSATFQYSGTSRDALIDVAQKLGLGFFFSDPENTEDVQCWYCMSDGEQKTTGESPVIEYIKNCAKHSWKNFDSFFDCWIDPRYAITFVNIAQMLGGSGLDEEIDMAIFNKNMTSLRGANGTDSDKKDSEKKANPQPMPKLLNNMTDGTMNMTAFQVKSYKEMSDNSSDKTLGLTNNNYYDANNPGIQSVDEGSISMEYSIPVNEDKLKNGFYIMAGPGKNLTYTQGDNGSYPGQHKSVQGGQLSDMQSDDDAASIVQNGNNMLASGNTNKFYECGEQHNLLNNSWLRKKYIKVVLTGINMQLMRGEKIPMFLLDRQNPQINYMGAKNEADMIYKKIAVNCCGWFIISNIKWIYDRNNFHDGTQWETVLEVTRREWPIPGYQKNYETVITAENNTATGTTNDGVNNTSTGSSENSSTGSTTNDNTTEAEINTNGLTDFMSTLYSDIKTIAEQYNKKIKLISGRRWSADENGNKIEGAPIVQEGNNWKFINAAGDIVWYSSKTSRHIYGEAFDIINGENTTFNEVGEIIMYNDQILAEMLDNGVYLMIETTKDDLGTSVQHFHLGTVDQTSSESINGQKKFWTNLIQLKGTATFTYNNKVYNMYKYLSSDN